MSTSQLPSAAGGPARPEGLERIRTLWRLWRNERDDPEPGLASIKCKVFALNFSDDEFNPEELHVLDRLLPQIPNSRFFVQQGSASSWGHLTMAHPKLWAAHVGDFMAELGGAKNADAKR